MKLTSLWEVIKLLNSEYSICIKIISIVLIIGMKIPDMADKWLNFLHKWNIIKLRKNG